MRAVAIGAVAPTAVVVEEAAQKLIGQPINEATLEAVSQAASDASAPISIEEGLPNSGVMLSASSPSEPSWQRLTAQRRNDENAR